MNKDTYVIVLISLLLLVTAFQGCITDDNSEVITIPKNTLFVNLDGSANFSSIQEAIDAAPENYTIYIHGGHYKENLMINKSINLTGENMFTTIIDGNGSENVIQINADQVHISQMTICHSGNGLNNAGILIESDDAVISNTIISESNHGIYSMRALKNNINNNTIKSNREYGIYVHSSNNIIIKDNLFYQNKCSLRIKGAHNCEVIRNHFNDSQKGMYFCCGAKKNIVYHNTFINHDEWGATDQVGGNEWYNSDIHEGNYWDDYIGDDVDEDGIGDIPYNVTTSGIQDIYPLMESII